MKTHRILLIIAILVSLFGIGYMGFSHGKGNKDDYGLLIVTAGLILSIFSRLLEKKDREKKS